VVKNLPDIIENVDNFYEGNLKKYYSIVVNEAQNLENPYHNYRHMMHVVWLCYQACQFYYGTLALSRREMRNLLIAALFHDFDHPGIMGNDDLNIERAVRAFKKYIIEEDFVDQQNIISLMWATEYPYKTNSAELSLPHQIIRDADMGQCFADAWIQQVLFGLGAEWEKNHSEILEAQVPFLNNLKFLIATQWGKKTFTQQVIDDKISEVNRLKELAKKARQ